MQTQKNGPNIKAQEVLKEWPSDATHYNQMSDRYVKTVGDTAYYLGDDKKWQAFATKADITMYSTKKQIENLAGLISQETDPVTIPMGTVKDTHSEDVDTRILLPAEATHFNMTKQCAAIVRSYGYLLWDSAVGKWVQEDVTGDWIVTRTMYEDIPNILSTCGPNINTGSKELGRKFDSGKLRYSLLPAGTVNQVVKVLEYGANKYAVDNWKHVPDAKTRYYDAAMRHIDAHWSGEVNDSETQLPHLAHAICCLMFLMALPKE